MSILSNHIFLIATASLAIQFVILFLLSCGYWMKRKGKYYPHAVFMTVSLVLHVSTIFAIMVPSFALAIVPYFIIRHPSTVASVVSIIHAPLGALSVLLGAWLILSWKLKGSPSCYSRKKIMLATLTLWVVSLLFGIALYIVLSWSVLTG